MTRTGTAPAPTLLAVPNVSEGRDAKTIQLIAEAFTAGSPSARLLNVHRDPDHHRSVFTLAGTPGSLAQVVLNGATEAVARIDLREHQGVHPRIGVIDVAPIVYLRPEDKGAACAEALVLGDLLADELEPGVPLRLARRRPHSGRVPSRWADGPRERIDAGEQRPTSARSPSPDRRAVLVAARPPLVAFNVEPRHRDARRRQDGRGGHPRRRPARSPVPAGARPLADRTRRSPVLDEPRRSHGDDWRQSLRRS